MVNCSEFLQEYSSYRDGLVDVARRDALEAHLRGCSSCARYDEVIGDGVELVRALEPVETSDDFMLRLQHRIYHVEDEMKTSRYASGTSVALTMAIAAAIGITAWAPTVKSKVPQLDLPPVIANAPVRPDIVPSVFLAGPILTAPDGSGSFARRETPTVFFRYSPLGLYNGDAQAQLASQSAQPR
ncbi:hypothetical protein BH23GEM6_BH23GEM6_27310 [soil metagenome]